MRHEFVFDDLGNFSYSSGPSAIIKHCPKMAGDKNTTMIMRLKRTKTVACLLSRPTIGLNARLNICYWIFTIAVRAGWLHIYPH